jgi:hypothetical protein
MVYIYLKNRRTGACDRIPPMNTQTISNRRTLAAAIYAAMAGFLPSCVIKTTG